MKVIKVEFSGRTTETQNSNIKLKVTLPFYSSKNCSGIYAKQQKEITDQQVKCNFNESWKIIWLFFDKKICAGGTEGNIFKANLKFCLTDF